jgi:uncharacterized protein
MQHRLVVVLAVLGCSQPVRVPPKPDPGVAVPLAIGETFRLASTVLGEQRVINVYLPPGYAKGAERYPVLYALDGGIAEDFPHVTGQIDVSIKNELIRPVIVVGIENTVRRRDLVGPTTIDEEKQMAPQAGGADRFRRFLREELKPQIAARYRTTAESAIVGESLAGLFVIETLLVEPALFDRYVAVDPSVWWNHQAAARSAEAKFAAWSGPPKALFVATAEMQEGITILLDAAKAHPPAGLAIHHAPMPEHKHGTIFPFAALVGFRLLLAR